MKRLKKLNLNLQLIAVFFSAVLILSLGHFLLYTHLFNRMQAEEAVISAERDENVRAKLDSIYTQCENAALEIITSWSFQAFAGVDADPAELTALQNDAQQILDDKEHIYRWFIMTAGSGQLISGNGVCHPDTYFGGISRNDTYTKSFWQDRFANHPGKFYYPAETFRHRAHNGKYEDVVLMPMSFQSYYDRQLMVVLLLDVESICREDTYLEEGAYFFSEEGSLLYTTDETPLITRIPENNTLKQGAQTYQIAQYNMLSGPVCIKLRSESDTAAMIRSNYILCLVVLLTALAAVALTVPRIIKRLLTPVDKMVDLVRQHAAPEETDLHSVSRELEEIFRTREQQAQDLAQTNAALSEYRLQSRLKNVYVDLQLPENREENAYLLFIQVRYQEKALESFTIPRSELENCLQEMMGATLQNLFDTALIFQLEPGRYAARITASEDTAEPMARFMDRLGNEEEFACFTVVCSDKLTHVDLAEVYDGVRQTARFAIVNRGSQLLLMPQYKDTTTYTYPKTEEQRLDELVRQGKIPQAVLLAERLLETNLAAGISHAQTELLCVALVNTVAYAAAASNADSHKIAAASSVYNTLATRCLTAKDYTQVVSDYIRSVAPAEEQQPEEDLLLSKIRQYLQENYHREFSSEEMAAALHVSRSYLSSYYKNKTGTNLSDSIQQYRIQKATELLRDPEVKISDIGTMVGINSPNTFLRQFRKYTGMTPREYRQQNGIDH